MDNHIRSLVAGLYAWISAVFFGGILVDIHYARFLAAITLPAEASLADTFLWLGFLAILAALAAIGVSWGFPAARNLFIASLFILSMEFLIPLLIAPFLPGINGVGPGLRLMPSGLGSILGIIGLYNLYKQMSVA